MTGGEDRPAVQAVNTVPLDSATLVPLQGQRGQGLYALIDTVFAPLVLPHRWYASEKGYIFRFRRVGERGKGKTVRLHHLILPPAHGLVVDHINRDPMDNRRTNLRLITPTANAMNRRAREGAVPFRGVTRRGRKFHAKLRVANTVLHLGNYSSAEDAARVYDLFALLIAGEVAQPNFDPAKYRALLERVRGLL